MLQTLRDKTSGWIATVILGLLIIPFAFFGMESYLSQRVETHVARIAQPPSWWPSAPQAWPLTMLWKTHDIDAQEYRQRLEMRRTRMRDEQGDKFDAKAFESLENKREVLDEMIDAQLMRLAAERSGIVVSDAEIRRQIQDIPDFQVDGKFDADRYQLLLASQNPPQTPRTFEQTVRDSLQYSLIPSRIARSGFVTDAELDRLMRLLGERRDVSFVVMPPAPVDTAPVTPAQVQDWYKSHARAYRSPETVRLEYVELDSSSLPPPVIDEAALRKRYDEQSAKYSTAEQRQVSHILVQVAADASDADKKAAEARARNLAEQARASAADFAALARARNLAEQARASAADFAALARANSDDAGSKGGGGSLGWLTKGGMPGAFDDAAFAMQAGEVRGPVKTDFGWHVIKVDQVRAGTRQPFEAVRAQLEQELLESDSERAFNELSGKLVDAVYKNPNSLAPAAKSLGLVVQTTPAFPRSGGPGIAADPKVLRAAFSETLIRDGTASDPIELSPTRTVLIRVLEHRPEAALPLSQVGDAVVMAIRADRQRKAAAAAADALLKAAKASGLPAAATAAALPVGEANDVRRGSFVPTRAAVEAFFGVPRPRDNLIPVDKTEAGGQFIVFAIRAVRDGDIGQVTAEERDQLRQQLSQASGSQAQEAFVRAARRQYKIQVAEDRL